MNEAGESCYPSIEKVCSETGLVKRSVITHLKIAEEKGWINKKKHGFRGQKWANNEYKLSWNYTKKKVVQEMHHVSKEKVVHMTTQGGAYDDQKVVQEMHPSTSVNSSSKYIYKNTYKDQLKLLSKINPQIAADFLVLRKAKKLPFTPTVLNHFKKEANKIGATLEEVLSICIHKSWAGFGADWDHGFTRPRQPEARKRETQPEERGGTKQGREHGLKILKNEANKMSSSKKPIIEAITDDVKTDVKKAIEIIASEDRVCFRAEVDSVRFKDDGVRADLKIPNTLESHELADVAGGSVLIVIEDPESYTESEEGHPKASPDQLVLGV